MPPEVIELAWADCKGNVITAKTFTACFRKAAMPVEYAGSCLRDRFRKLGVPVRPVRLDLLGDCFMFETCVAQNQRFNIAPRCHTSTGRLSSQPITSHERNYASPLTIRRRFFSIIFVA